MRQVNWGPGDGWLRNLSTDSLEIWQFDYVRRSTPYALIFIVLCMQSNYSKVLCKLNMIWYDMKWYGMIITSRVFFIFSPFFTVPSAHVQLTLRSVNLCSMQSKTCFGGNGVFLCCRFAKAVKSSPFKNPNPQKHFSKGRVGYYFAWEWIVYAPYCWWW